MSKTNKNKLSKLVFGIFFMSFLVIYFSELTGYYEYKNYEKKSLTEKQIKKFEDDIKSGKEVDINKYLINDTPKYNNSLSNLASKLSNYISKIVNNGVEYTFKYISKLIE